MREYERNSPYVQVGTSLPVDVHSQVIDLAHELGYITKKGGRVNVSATIAHLVELGLEVLEVRHAAGTIAAVDHGRWVPWMCYILSVLDEKSTDSDTFLRELQTAIDGRLEKGDWLREMTVAHLTEVGLEALEVRRDTAEAEQQRQEVA